MEDSHRKTEDSSHQEDTEDGTEESGASSSAASFITLTCASSRPGPAETPSPCPVVGGSSDPPEGGNNAKRTAVANGQPPSTASQHYMPREVPPRFRNQQEPKVLLKRGQPPLSCMLLGGGNGGDAMPRLPLQEPAEATDPTVDSVSLHSSSDTSASPTYANYTWGLDSGGQPSAQGMDEDNSDAEKWQRPEDSWNSDQTPHSASSEMDGSAGLVDSSSQHSEYAEASVIGGASSLSENKETIKHFNSKVLPLSGDKEGPQSPNLNYNPDDHDGAVSGRDILTHSASEESSSTLLGPASALYQTLCKNEERITGAWEEPQVGPNSGGDGAVTSTELWDTGEDPVGKSSDAEGGRSRDGTGISQEVLDGDTVGSYKQAATEWTSDTTVGASREDVKEISEVSTDSLQDSSVFANSMASRDDNQKAADDWDGSEGESTGRESNDDGTQTQNLVQSPSTCQVLPPEATLQSMINHTNLDPKVLCNTGWGKTQIKQNVAWDFEGDTGNVGWDEEVHTDRRKEGWKEAGDLSGSKMQKQHEEVGQVSSPQGWTGHGEMKVSGHKGSGWGEDQEGEGTRRREGTGWNQGGGSEWTPLPGGGGWNEERGSDRKNKDEGLWGSSEELGQRSSGWGGSSVKQHQGWGEKLLPSQIPNKQEALKTQNQQPQQQSQTQQQMPGYPKALQDRGRSGVTDDQSKGTGWTCGPIPQPSVVEASGWEEPSPQSISRKMEIDDGTSAWGDPSRYNSKNVNLWDKNSSQGQQQSSGRQAGVPSKNPVPAVWARSSGPSDMSMENSTTAWGKSFDASAGWGESSEPGKGGGWGNSHSHPVKSGSKSMQEGWGDEGSNASRHSSWEEEDSGTGVWAGRGSQSSMPTYNSGGWGQSQGSRRLNAKSPLKGNSGDSWVSPVIRQFSNMGVTDEDSSMAHDRHDRRGINDGEMRRGGRTGGAFRSQTSKEMACGDTGPYMDKVGGHSMFGSGGIPPLRVMHQAGVHPLNPSPGIRAQVPHQFLPPQVPGPMLKPMAPPSGGMFPPQLSPQHIAMLGGIHPHMQQFQLACQLLLQQQQQQQQQQQFLNQRKFSPPLRQQTDPQQLARIMAILQQQQAVGGPKLSPSPMGGHVPKHPDAHLHHMGLNAHKQSDAPVHAAMGGPELHSKGPAAFTGAVKLADGSSYSQYDVLGSSWHRSTGGKVDVSPANPTWPPEFQPGVPWKGVQSPEPEPDPYMTPVGMLGSSLLSDTEHHLLQDNTGSNSLNTCMPSPGAWPYSASDPPLTAHGTAKYSELKSSWPPEPIGHGKSWRTNRNTHMPRPPPGLTSQKQPWSGEGPQMPRAWGGGASGPESPFKSEWSDGGTSAGKSWLLLRNLTPQIDGSTLRTICLQHGPLLTFHLGLTQGSALIRYCSPHEAAKAQSALHMCVLGNTTILAEFMSEEDVIRYFTHSQAAGVVGSPESSPGSDPASREGERPVGSGADGDAAVGWQGLDVTPGSAVEAPGLALLSQWSNSGGEGAGKGVWGGVAPGYHGSSLWGTPQLEDGTAGLLPGNLLGGGTDSL